MSLDPVDLEQMEAAVGDEIAVSEVLANEDLVNHIIRSLDIIGICQVARINNIFRRVCKRASQWERLVLLTRPITTAQVSKLPRKQSCVTGLMTPTTVCSAFDMHLKNLQE